MQPIFKNIEMNSGRHYGCRQVRPRSSQPRAPKLLWTKTWLSWRGPGQFFNPTGVTFLNYDEILIANEMNHRIQQFNL